ncbi:uncharacterized protein LOC143212765 isoform X4 [Lasioglossum baleicum]|uniref:uncharacterized protein LOC143212765 isoform X4 n=1 Tax=Lasioglossum baleicum TaxID=434251 RepID=UPI003FCE85D8
MSSLDYLDLCRLCLVKDRVSVPIFEGEGNDLFLKIAACLPVKVAREDKLPKKICDDCVYKIELFYEFWNTTANAEKRLLQWLGEVSVEGGKQGYVSNVLNPNVMKQEQSTENRLDGGVMQQVGEHQNNMGMSMMDNMGLGIPMMMSNTNQQQQQITSVPMDTSGSSAQNVQAVPGPSSQATHNQISQNQTGSTQQEDEEESSEDEENSDDECDGDEGLPVKEESEEDPNSRTIEPTTFVNVSLACDEAGPSGLQQQKLTDMPEMSIPQPADGDPKTGISTTAETIQYPAQPLFVECSGPPLLDHDQMSIKMKTSPITDFKEEQCMLSDTECEHTMTDDGLYLGDSSYLSFPSDVTQTEVSNDSVKYDASSKPIPSLLVPVRDPETKIIKNVLVPPEMQDESGMNLIKSILIPVQEPDGMVTYVIKSVMVPIKPEKQVKQPVPVPLPIPVPVPVKETPPKPDKIEKKEKKRKTKLSKRVEDDEEDEKDIKTEEAEQAESAEPNEEVDSILADLQTTCPFCQKSFKSVQQVNKHVRREHQQPFRCKKCHYSYRKEEELEKHMEVHEKDTYHKCPFCHLQYKRMSGLRAHQIREHSNVDPVCLRDRAKEGVIIGPEDSPTGSAGTRIYVCQVCGNHYDQKSYLIAHNRIAHGYQRNEVRRFKCRVCKKKFTFQHSLESHLCNEPSFLCSHCGKKFSTNYTMLLHMRSHTGERPHQCTVCQKSFSRAMSLRIHILTHTGERPYICDLCGRSFTQRTTMMIHRRRHPGNHPPPPPLFLSRRISNLNEEKE